MLVTPSSHTVDPELGALSNSSRTYEKKLADLKGLYQNEALFNEAVAGFGDKIVYEVQDKHPEQSTGDLIFGVTKMQPGKIGDEFYMTRGHIHAVANRPEIYYGEKGTGLMLMESPEGETKIVPISPRVLCYVPPFWIHRSVNVGDEPFVMTFMYPSDSGQDYGVIEQTNGMASRIVAAPGGWAEVPNTSYIPRSAEQIEAIYRSGDQA